MDINTAILEMLFTVSEFDGKFDSEEINEIIEIGSIYGITSDVIKSYADLYIIRYKEGNTDNFKEALNFIKKEFTKEDLKKLFDNFLKIISADSEVTDSEASKVTMLAELLGIDASIYKGK